MTAARDETSDEQSASSEQDTESGKDKSQEAIDDVRQAPVFTHTIEEASESVQQKLSNDLDLEQKADELSEDKDFSKPELRNILSDLARSEINKNRKMYRGIIYQNLTNQRPGWDDSINKVEVTNKIDDLMDTSVQVWVDRHIDEFVSKLEENNEGRSLQIKDIAKASIAASLVRGIIERTTSDAIYNYGKEIGSDVLDWFITNTSLSPDQLFNAVEAMMRALFGV